MCICRFCLDEDDPTYMISPCDCDGSIKYVHRRCLDQWVYTDLSRNTKCFICNTVYIGYESNSRKLIFLFTEFLFFIHFYILLFYY